VGPGKARGVGGIALEIPGTLAGLCPAHSVGWLWLVSRSNARAPVCMAQQPPRRTIACRTPPGDERARALSRKVHALEGKLAIFNLPLNHTARGDAEATVASCGLTGAT